MTGDAAKRTFGENFLLELQKAESRGLLFAVVEDTAARFYPQYNLEVQLGKLSDFDSVAVYQDKLARVRIEYNAKAVRDIHQRLVGLTITNTRKRSFASSISSSTIIPRWTRLFI